MAQLKTYYIEVVRDFTTLRLMAFECEDKTDAYNKMVTEWPLLASRINFHRIEELKEN